MTKITRSSDQGESDSPGSVDFVRSSFQEAVARVVGIDLRTGKHSRDTQVEVSSTILNRTVEHVRLEEAKHTCDTGAPRKARNIDPPWVDGVVPHNFQGGEHSEAEAAPDALPIAGILRRNEQQFASVEDVRLAGRLNIDLIPRINIDNQTVPDLTRIGMRHMQIEPLCTRLQVVGDVRVQLLGRQSIAWEICNEITKA